MQLNKSMIQKIDIENYFNAEKQAGFIFFIMGAIALFSAITFFFLRKNESYLFWKGLGLLLYIMVFIAIVADYYAEKRAGEYLQKLENHFKNEL